MDGIITVHPVDPNLFVRGTHNDIFCATYNGTGPFPLVSWIASLPQCESVPHELDRVIKFVAKHLRAGGAVYVKTPYVLQYVTDVNSLVCFYVESLRRTVSDQFALEYEEKMKEYIRKA